MSRVLPILFNTDMVRAILDGRKTVTRRLINPQQTGSWQDNIELMSRAPYQHGDILYVRETWCDDRQFTHDDTSGQYFYRADSMYPRNGDSVFLNVKWHPSIHMPKEAARIWLKVKDVRVERLQEITAEDAIKEGAQRYIHLDGSLDEQGTRTSFIGIWNSTIKKSDIDRYGWDANPWVWVIEFEWCEKPENF